MASCDPFLLAADIDGTLLGDELGEGLLHSFAAQNGHAILAYVTGRHRSSVLALIAEGRLPRPRFICTEVGTELLDLDDPSNRIGQAYADRVGAKWSLEAIYRLGQGEGIRAQDFEHGQPRFQAGFYWDARPDSLDAFRARLSSVNEIYIQASHGMYIDVLPVAVGKGEAVRFLLEQLQLSPERVLVAGDSGNDRQMFETGYRGIVPSNALEELKALARQPWHYHSPYPAARGVLDGLTRLGFAQSPPSPGSARSP